MMKNNIKITSYLIIFIVIAFVWQIISMIIKSPIIPTPYDIINNILYNDNKEIIYHILVSMRRILYGIVIAMLIALPIGIVGGFNPKCNKVLSPLLYFAYPIPKFALLPIFMLLFGLGETTKIMMVGIVIFFPMVVSIRDCIRNFSKDIYECYYALGATKLQIVYHIILKGTLPSMFTTLRISVGTALSVLFFAENFGTRYGMGYYIMDSWMRINYTDMYTGIVLISFLGLSLFLLIDYLNIKICRWQNT